MTFVRALRKALRRLIGDESGQSLIVVVSSMTVLLGVAAFGIDAATWMAKHHQAQVVADSAALAAAQCLANPGQSGTLVLKGTQTTVPACTSSSDTADADTDAIDYAAANGLTITASDVNIANNTVRVTAPATSSGVFSAVSGIRSTSQTAAAGAGWTNTTAACTTPGGANCDFMFAYNSNCSSTTNGINLNMSGNTTVEGNIQSNGNLNSNTSGNISLGNGSYGPNGTGTCAATTNYSGHNPWTSPPTQASTDYPFPIDYTKDFPACGGSGELACQANGYPSFCTVAGSSITLTGSGSGDVPITGNIYCASGSGTISNPSTWTGSIQINVSGNYTWNDSFVGGTITYNVSGNEALSSCGYQTNGYASVNCSSSVPTPVTGNYPIFYATSTSSTAINLNVSGGQTLNGDVFAPNGTAYLNLSGNKTLVTCIEGNNVTGNVSGTFQGDGPPAGQGAGSGPGNVSLTQ